MLVYGDAERCASCAAWRFAARQTIFFSFMEKRRVHHHTCKHKHMAIYDVFNGDAGRDVARGAGRIE